MKVSKNTLLRINNILLYLGFTFLLGTGLLLVYRLPPGSRGGRGLSMLGMGRHDWGDLHFYAALGVVALMLVHLVLNWAWMRKIAAKGGNWKLWTGLGLGAVIVGLFFVFPIDKGEDDHGGHGDSGGPGVEGEAGVLERSASLQE